MPKPTTLTVRMPRQLQALGEGFFEVLHHNLMQWTLGTTPTSFWLGRDRSKCMDISGNGMDAEASAKHGQNK